MSKLAQYRNYLKAEGFPHEVHDDYVVFKHEGGSYVLTLDDEDQAFFHMIFPSFWSIQSDAERRRALELAAQVTMHCKGIKVFPAGNDTSASAEVFLPRPEDFREVFPRALRALQHATRFFCLGMASEQVPRGFMDGVRKLFGAGDAGPEAAA